MLNENNYIPYQDIGLLNEKCTYIVSVAVAPYR
jgi:hypothetical protein